MGDRASDARRPLSSAPPTSCRCRRRTSWPTPSRLGVAGVEWLERLAALPEQQRRVRIPTITDPRGTDFAAAARLKQQDWMLALERRAIAAFEALGVLMTDTCINYQTIMPAVRGEHMAYGDTGVVIYSNSVLGARVEFRGRAVGAGRRPDRPHAALRLSSAGAAPRARCCCASSIRRASCTSGARWAASSAASPATTGRCRRWSASTACPTSDELKHFGAALASYGSVALFHMLGVTPEARRTRSIRSLPVAGDDRRGRSARIPGGLSRGASTRSMSWCSPSPQLSLHRDARARRHAGWPHVRRYRCWW